MQRNMETRFEAVDKRFEDLHRNMDKRFEAVDKRVRRHAQAVNGMQWMVGGGVVLLATMMSLFPISSADRLREAQSGQAGFGGADLLLGAQVGPVA